MKRQYSGVPQKRTEWQTDASDNNKLMRNLSSIFQKLSMTKILELFDWGRAVVFALFPLKYPQPGIAEYAISNKVTNNIRLK